MVIREAILKAERTAQKFGGIWHVCTAPGQGMLVVAHSYYFDEDGNLKPNRWASLYNTRDQVYNDWKVTVLSDNSYRLDNTNTGRFILHNADQQ